MKNDNDGIDLGFDDVLDGDRDLLDDDSVLLSLDDPEFAADAVSEDPYAAVADDDDGSGIPTNPFAFGLGDDEFLADDADGFGLDGDVTTAAPETFTPSIDEGDFLDPAQRFLFKRLKDRIRAACNVNSKNTERLRALDWIFVPTTKDADGLEFDPVCRALGARPVVVRARTMHQLWRANIFLSAPLHGLSAIPPTALMSEISSVIGPNLPIDMAREIWYWPSISGEALRAKFAEVSDRDYQATLRGLEAHGYVAIAFGRIYFISRNPNLMSLSGRNRFAFAQSIYGEY